MCANELTWSNSTVHKIILKRDRRTLSNTGRTLTHANICIRASWILDKTDQGGAVDCFMLR